MKFFNFRGFKKLLFVSLIGILFVGFSFWVKAQDCGADLDCQISQIQNEIDALTPAHEQNKTELTNLRNQIASLNKKIEGLSIQLKNTENEILQREEDLGYAKALFEEKTKNHYRFLRLYDPIMPFLASADATDAFREANFRSRAADEDRKLMEEYAADLLKLKSDKEALEKNQTSLASLKSQVSEKEKFLAGEVEKVEGYIASLSAKQQELLAAKSGGFTASVGDSDLADDYKASIKGFRESAPAGSFAVFSFGGYTHRKGMSQYGARGRAENNKTASQILKAYYGKEPVSKDTGGTIIVDGTPMDFENYYLMGISEMPSSWHIEALKAQAIAARTYAYRYKIEGKNICTTESCQVFRSSKASNPPDSWRQAVESTRGQILEDVVTYYSSTSGGYLTTMGWDTTDGGGGSNFLDKAYEKLGGSPWLYKAWYRQGYTSSGDTCGVSDPWLTNEEFTDIVNAAVVLRQGGDDRVTSTSTSCWGGNPYSISELKQKGGVQNVSSVNVSQGDGQTNTVTINGSISFSGDEFKQAFNLRAPGYLMIPQKGFAFFNIEKK